MATATATVKSRPARTSEATRRQPARPKPRPAAQPKRRRSAAGRVRVPAGPVGRTAVAVGGLADSSLVVRLTRGRLWIGLVGVLLVGIVGLNVAALSFSASSSNAARAADELERMNSSLRAQIATQLTNEEVQQTASELGLLVPTPGAIRYLKARPGDAAAAAKRLRSGELSATAPAAAVSEVAVPVSDPATVAAPTDPALAADPAATAPAPAAPTDPAAVAPVAAPAAAPAPAPGTAVGGVVTP